MTELQQAEAINLEAVAEMADLFKRLSHPARLAIVRHLLEGERSVSAIEQELGIKQPSLSQHLTELRKGDTVVSRRHGKLVFYRIEDERVVRLLGMLDPTFEYSRWPQKRGASRAPISAAVFGQLRTASRTADRSEEEAAIAPSSEPGARWRL